ncbi:Predicted metalloprotease, contains C-terminal PDZ domain [Pseudarcicella hirudinis]|uniref:Predicted metalloprotease, contains C-terminal PDZ domain n=2 Tax=Pseudarcicella hirudinis TaxID=1079859 RepID=A0A1I5MKZ2_9BACT|nr:PDZ domain-containing protein [Pseudarcicella hirudinis]SFP10209.1 Predicted metalloprotease, contains C-terminal PDZ domain [Pseudarcicella hirudinis]
MKKIVKTAILLLIGYLSSAQSKTPTPKIEYVLSMDQPQTHYFDVVVKASNLDAKTKQQGFLDFKMAVWTPGSYLVREYAKNVESVTASSGNTPLKSDKINKNTWRVRLQSNTQEVTLKYKVYAFELSVRTSFLDDSHGYLNPASIFLYVNDWRHTPSTLSVKPYKNWNTVSTGLKALGNNTFEAENLDILIDSPIEIGVQKVLNFDLKGIPHKVAMYGEAKYDEAKVTADIKKVCETATTVVGEHPCKDYTFIIHNILQGGGGLEHLNSTTCQTSRTSYENPKTYQSFLSLIAHEYFHLWNVKRIRPKALGPFDYENENYTHMLWFSEGCTSFYQSYILRRANLMTPEEYLTTYADEISVTENQPGNKIQSAAESSWDAWIKYYRPNENSRNSTISYYGKGEVLGGILNLLIIQSTKGAKNLDDVMKTLYQEYYKKLGRGFSDEEFQKAAESVAGRNLNDFFQKYVFGTEPIPYNSFLEAVGMQLTDQNAGKNDPYLGADLRNGKISNVWRDSPAYNDGLNVGDEILTIDDTKLENLPAVIASKKVGDVISVKVKRDGLEKTYKVTLVKSPIQNFKIEPVASPSKEQQDLYKKWLFL